MYKSGSLELPAETIAEDGNCLYFEGSAHLHLKAFRIMCFYVLRQGKFTKCTWKNGVCGNIKKLILMIFIKCQVFILYEGYVTQLLTVVDGEVVTERN
jgi:hypothetical protein